VSLQDGHFVVYLDDVSPGPEVELAIIEALERVVGVGMCGAGRCVSFRYRGVGEGEQPVAVEASLDLDFFVELRAGSSPAQSDLAAIIAAITAGEFVITVARTPGGVPTVLYGADDRTTSAIVLTFAADFETVNQTPDRFKNQIRMTYVLSQASFMTSFVSSCHKT
jgi:hypothetical protein